jgi:hypothetical protein
MLSRRNKIIILYYSTKLCLCEKRWLLLFSRCEQKTVCKKICFQRQIPFPTRFTKYGLIKMKWIILLHLTRYVKIHCFNEIDKYVAKGYPKSWAIYNPTWEYTFWNKRKILDLFSRYPVLKRYEHFFLHVIGHHIEKCDFSRFMIMAVIGGVYVDLDIRCLKSWDKMVEHRELLIFFEPLEHSEGPDGITPRLYNGILASRPNHWFWIEWMDYIMSGYNYNKGVLQNTGPVNFSRFVQEKEYHRTSHDWFGETCLVLPFIASGGLSAKCKNFFGPNPDSNCLGYEPGKITKQPFRTMYAYNCWHEGTGWGTSITLRD